ncbi:MAG: single-stranded DNA-binding protein [Lewinellaceae bacterium]|nr:single-stranded DNA-binding protein [Lewinellaceae bacterium]
MVNKVILIGNLGRDPEVRTLENGAMVAKFPVATNESYRDKNNEWQTITEWHDVVVWRSLAERAEKTLQKGSLVFIEGKLTHRKYQDNNGIDRYITEVVASTFRLLDRKEGGSRTGYSDTFPTEDSYSASAPQSGSGGKESATFTEDLSNMEDDDLPF